MFQHYALPSYALTCALLMYDLSTTDLLFLNKLPSATEG